MRRSGARLSIVSFVALFSLCGASRAQNIFELIFGGGQHSVESHRAASPAPRYASPRRRVAHKWSGETFAKASDSSPSPETMKLSYAEAWGGKAGAAEKCCASAADMIARVTKGDPTLRQGDAFMTSDGLRVFVGDRQGDTKFVTLGQAQQLSRALKERLQAMEKQPSAASALAPPSRSRAETAAGPRVNLGDREKSATGAAKDRLIAAQNGKTIRLVGGYAN
ncbi:hypothetical protein [uncultured Rhodoblastus sp.]|uniref:hypothetical protein n=1 Tax=uncultured Rhodoblastus sp. TaxID=543037 RepID=UPI0025F5BD75|nr:hypothetical protein [uncultured Rhodoblastus sp.]